MTMSVPDSGGGTSGPFTIGDPSKPHTSNPVGTGTGGALAPLDDPEPSIQTNPYDDEGWGTVTLAGTIGFPGIVTDISGADREWEWDVKKGAKKQGSTATHKGQKANESIKITVSCPRRSDFDELFAFRDAVCPTEGEKPATFNIVNQVVNFNRINRVSIKKFGQPKFEKGKGGWTCEFEFIENSPSKDTKTGPQDPAKPDGGGKGGKDDGKAPAAPKDAADKEIDELVKKAQQP